MWPRGTTHLIQPGFEPAGMDAAGHDVGIARESDMERRCCRNTLDFQLSESTTQPAERPFATLVPHDELAKQTIVERRNGVAGIEQPIESRIFSTTYDDRSHNSLRDWKGSRLT